MVATRKVESKNEETQERVRGRAVVATDPGEGMAKLGHKIAKLMAALPQTRQGSSHPSAPANPWEHGCRQGCSGRGTPSYPNPHSSSGGPAQMTPVHNLPMECGVEGTVTQSRDQGNCRPSTRRLVQLVAKTQPLFNILDARAGAIWLENALPQGQLQTTLGKLGECGSSATGDSCPSQQ